MADLRPQTQGLLSTSTSTLETDVNNLLENIVNVYKCVDPRLVAIKLDKFVSGLPYSFSNIQFCASRTPNYSTFYDFQCFLKATTAAESSSSFETDKPDTVDFSIEQYHDAAECLRDCLTKENLESINKIAEKEDTLSENQLAFGIGVHIIKKLSGRATVDRSKLVEQCPCGCDDKADSGAMWIGAPHVWHGELDIIGGSETTSITSIATSTVDQDSEQEEVDRDSELEEVDRDSELEEVDQDRGQEEVEDDESPGMEVKTHRTNICHILSQAIVFGWTEFNRHKNYSPYIPSILIDSRKYMFVLYNPDTDSLLTSEGFVHYYPFEDYFGLINLWIILNHRLFFNKHSIDDESIPPCGFKRVMAADLSKYQSLNDYKQSITVLPKIVNNIELQPRITVHAGLKRQRLS